MNNRLAYTLLFTHAFLIQAAFRMLLTGLHQFFFLVCQSQNTFVAIVDLPEGEHQYKFYVDGQWTHDPAEVSSV